MCPSREDCPNGARKFHSTGIIKVDNIKIAWPKRPHDRRSPPLAEIVECVEESDEMVTHLKVTHPSLYKSIHDVLKPNTLYTIVPAGKVEFRKIPRWHFITECGLKVRDGGSLRKIWEEWRKRHLGDKWRMRNVNGVPWMTFQAIGKIRVRGKYDMKCELA